MATTWTQSELDSLAELYPGLGARAMAELGVVAHPVYSIRQMAYKLRRQGRCRRFAGRPGPRPGRGSQGCREKISPETMAERIQRMTAEFIAARSDLS